MTRWRPIATTLVSLAGLGLAAFLTWAHYFDQGAINNTCPLGSKGAGGFVNCGAVTTSPESMVLGVPVALWGLLFFVAMTVMSLPRAWRSPSMRLAQARLALNVVGMGFVLYLVSVEFLQLHHLCLYCTFVHLLQFALFMLVLTGWNDTGYVQSHSSDAEYDELEDEEWEEEPEPARDMYSAPGNRLPRSQRSKARARA